MLRGLSNARAFLSIVNVEACLHPSSSKILASSRPARRLCAVNAHCPTVGEIIEQWSHRFENAGVPEPVESIEHIVAHVVGTSKVSELLSSARGGYYYKHKH